MLRRRIGGIGAAIIFLTLGTRCTSGLRSDELDCEMAVARLNECCPGFDSTALHCDYSDGCGTTYPSITRPESECIRSQSCVEAQKSGVCERAQKAEPIQTDADGGLSPHPQVCP